MITLLSGMDYKPETKLYWLHDLSKEELVAMGVRESSICENINADGLTQCEMTLAQAESLIPKDTLYCYKRENGKFKYCPFWDKIEQFPHQSNGYCHFLEGGDSAMGGMLWDQCKECRVGDDMPDQWFEEDEVIITSDEKN